MLTRRGAAGAAACMLVLAACSPPLANDSVAEPPTSSPAASPPATSATTAPTTTPATAAPPAPSPSRDPLGIVVPLRVELLTEDEATAGFVEEAMAILTDPRGWARAGVRFVQDDVAAFRLVLAEGSEVDQLCAPYDTGGRFSCQNGPVVALNADRWRDATSGWPDDLAAYRTYLVNHEVGHLLHLHHPSPQCPGDGLPAPVMLQQSTELGQCTANPWPLPWEVDLAAARREPLAPPADHEVADHQPSPPPQQQDLDHEAAD